MEWGDLFVGKVFLRKPQELDFLTDTPLAALQIGQVATCPICNVSKLLS
jgi:hypothetical protein